ncbi:hypothetical protein BC628DRAFT_1335109 [Trametes gibbosa]|nr:hypothetical protein BC628DRAFT_1335109 [Trametes gibbosa]
MSSAFRTLAKHARPLSNPTRTVPRTSRAFHSPFAVLASSQPSLTTPPAAPSSVYEKQLDPSPDPVVSAAGHRTYVVSAPDPAHTPYEVPSGAYPTSAPYQPYDAPPAPAAPRAPRAQLASTALRFAHPITQRLLPQRTRESAAHGGY